MPLSSLLALIDSYRNLVRQSGSPFSADLASLTEQEEAIDLPLTRESMTRALDRGHKGLEQIGRLVCAMKAFQDVGRQGRVPQDLNPIVENAATVATHTWKAVAELSLQLGQDLPLVPCWAGEIVQVVVSLLSNASQAIRDKLGDSGKGKITVETLYDGATETVEIRVSDNGVGIPDAIADKIFDPFFTTRPVGQGSGQGLAQVHAIVVRQHGGSVRFDSRVGEGSCFVISLPVHIGES
jgi:two-component system, NtrC family, sensor kinase